MAWQVKVTGDNGQVFQLENLHDDRTLVLRGHTEPITSHLFLEGTSRVFTCDVGGTVKLWETGSGQELLSLKGPPNACLSSSPDGRTLVLSNGDNTAIWHATSLPADLSPDKISWVPRTE